MIPVETIPGQALVMILSLDPILMEIISLSLRVTLTAVIISCAIGLPVGAALAISRFPGRGIIVVLLNAMMGLPPVVAGLLVFFLVSASGPLAWLELLYTPSAMIIAQCVLVTPIVAALSRQTIEDLDSEYHDLFASLGLTTGRRIAALLWDARFSLLTVALAGFGRASAEVGAVIIVGGNINHVSRMMTTSIALETSRGNLELALALGLILLVIALAVNAAVMGLRGTAERAGYG